VSGMPAAWKHVIVGQSWVIGSGHWSEPFVTKDGVDILGTQSTTDKRLSMSAINARLCARPLPTSEPRRNVHTLRLSVLPNVRHECLRQRVREEPFEGRKLGGVTTTCCQRWRQPLCSRRPRRPPIDVPMRNHKVEPK
jgi:hypothetical protein